MVEIGENRTMKRDVSGSYVSLCSTWLFQLCPNAILHCTLLAHNFQCHDTDLKIEMSFGKRCLFILSLSSHTK
jgi:hypothetical protein